MFIFKLLVLLCVAKLAVQAWGAAPSGYSDDDPGNETGRCTNYLSDHDLLDLMVSCAVDRSRLLDLTQACVHDATALRSENRVLRDELVSLQDRHKDLHHEHRRLAQHHTALAMKNAALLKSLEDLKQERDSISVALQSSEEVHGDLMAENGYLLSRLRELSHEVTTMLQKERDDARLAVTINVHSIVQKQQNEEQAEQVNTLHRKQESLLHKLEDNSRQQTDDLGTFALQLKSDTVKMEDRYGQASQECLEKEQPRQGTDDALEDYSYITLEEEEFILYDEAVPQTEDRGQRRDTDGLAAYEVNTSPTCPNITEEQIFEDVDIIVNATALEEEEAMNEEHVLKEEGKGDNHREILQTLPEKQALEEDEIPVNDIPLNKEDIMKAYKLEAADKADCLRETVDYLPEEQIPEHVDVKAYDIPSEKEEALKEECKIEEADEADSLAQTQEYLLEDDEIESQCSMSDYDSSDDDSLFYYDIYDFPEVEESPKTLKHTAKGAQETFRGYDMTKQKRKHLVNYVRT